MSNPTTDYSNIYEATKKLQDLRFQHWLHHDIFTWFWWLLFALVIVPWIIWWKLADKTRLIELLLFGALSAVISVTLDTIGTLNLWWMYKTEFCVQFPGLLAADITDIPVVFMLAHQYCATWKSFAITILLISGIAAFVIEPLCKWLDVYNPLSWRHVYSFAIYCIMAMSLRLTVIKLQETELRSAQK
ncbi:CBO0543 family protein [Alicyclobacillus suci]|uniref:CBO0543 family protein n=1 Tax=Alicyclobacillus suci TaxID=2816080 RepID=UPI001A8C0B7F|nr:CBO0543 family protein [Alicyclobacillus suci]